VRAGRTADTGTFEQLRHLTRTQVAVDTAIPVDDLTRLPGVHDAVVAGAHAEFSVDHTDLNRVLEHLVGHGVRSLQTSPPTLEELFLRHYDEADGRNGRPHAAGMVASVPVDAHPSAGEAITASRPLIHADAAARPRVLR
jgi:ABC-2 type transport system ATP-binding protein